MDTIQAAILLAKIDVFDKEINSRIKIAYRYNKFFFKYRYKIFRYCEEFKDNLLSVSIISE